MNNSCTEKTHNKSVLIVYPIRGRIKPDAFRPYRRAAAVPSGNASCKKLPRDSIPRLISRIRRERTAIEVPALFPGMAPSRHTSAERQKA